MDNDVKFEVLKYFNLKECLVLQGFEHLIVAKYRYIWRTLTNTIYSKSNVQSFLDSNFIFGTAYKSCKHLDDLIDTVCFMMGTMDGNSEKIEFCLLLFMGLMELEDRPYEKMIIAMSSIFNPSVVSGFDEVAKGLFDYYAKLVEHRQKVLRLQFFQLLHTDQYTFETLNSIALEQYKLHVISNFYLKQIEKSTVPKLITAQNIESNEQLLQINIS